MPDVRGSQFNQSNQSNRKGIGFGIFLILAGAVLLSERLGWLPSGTDWLFPAILIAWGAGEVFAWFSSH